MWCKKESELSSTGSEGKGSAWEPGHRKWQTKYSKLDTSLKCNSGLYSEQGHDLMSWWKASEYSGEKHTGDTLAKYIVVGTGNGCEKQQDGLTKILKCPHFP